MVRFGSAALDQMTAGTAVGGLTVAPLFDRIMAYPELHDASYRLLARYDRDRLLPGVDEIPPDSVTLLETNPRFVAAFLAGLNHELNRELLWRRYPTDQRGTPLRRFWDRVGGGTDVAPIHQWRPLSSSLVDVAGGESNLVLLIRGELLRRYPNTVVLAIKSIGPSTPSTNDADIKRPIFSGLLEPDISFFGFDLQDDDIHTGDGWFFALQEQITEPRFGFDETVDPLRGALDVWRETAWTDTAVAAGATFTRRAAAPHRRPEPAHPAAQQRRHGRRGDVPEPSPSPRPRTKPDMSGSAQCRAPLRATRRQHADASDRAPARERSIAACVAGERNKGLRGRGTP